MENGARGVDTILSNLQGMSTEQASAVLREALLRIEKPAPVPVAAPPVAPTKASWPERDASDSEDTVKLKRAALRSQWVLVGAIVIAVLVSAGTAWVVIDREAEPTLSADDAPPVGRRAARPAPVQAARVEKMVDEVEPLPALPPAPRHRAVAKASAPKHERVAAPVAAEPKTAPKAETKAEVKPDSKALPEQFEDEDLKRL